MDIFIAIFGPSLLSLLMLALGSSLARSKNAHQSWGVLAGTIILLQGFLLVGAWLFFGTTAGGSLLTTLTQNSWLCAGFALWLACLVTRAVYSVRGRKKFADSKDHDAA
ncbi:MAG: hypothetical protein WCH99_11740 [Verrucomicrobiota bacterium]